jgi:predicted phosphodiesterase
VIRVALISDIHGNCVALDAVLADLAGRAVDEVVCLGDVAAGGPQPREVIARVRELGCQVVRGNADGWLLAGLPPGRSDETRRLSEVVAWTRGRLAKADYDYLAALPAMLRVATGELDLLWFHGSPCADTDSSLPTTPTAELDRLLANAPSAHLFAAGHTARHCLSIRAASASHCERSRRATRRCRPGPSTPSPPAARTNSRLLTAACRSTSKPSRRRRRRCHTQAGRTTSRRESRAGTPAHETRQFKTIRRERMQNPRGLRVLLLVRRAARLGAEAERLGGRDPCNRPAIQPRSPYRRPRQPADPRGGR